MSALLLVFLAAAPDLGGVLALIGKTSMAQACPVAPDKAYTNAHVAVDAPFIWSSGGHQGLLGAPTTTILDKFRDLAVVAPYRSVFPRWYAISQAQPQVGDRVFFVGFDFRKKGDAFAPRVFEAKVIRLVNGHLIYSPSGVPGTSGSCVLNERGEVVAINAGGRETEDKAQIGVAVGVWGALLEIGR